MCASSTAHNMQIFIRVESTAAVCENSTARPQRARVRASLAQNCVWSSLCALRTRFVCRGASSSDRRDDSTCRLPFSIISSTHTHIICLGPQTLCAATNVSVCFNFPYSLPQLHHETPAHRAVLPDLRDDDQQSQAEHQVSVEFIRLRAPQSTRQHTLCSINI